VAQRVAQKTASNALRPGGPQYAGKSALFALASIDFSDFSALIEGIAGVGPRQVVGFQVFEESAPGDGRVCFAPEVEVNSG
jgi:hypothetical protein